jgi:rRNA maturation endonuclease Nob1
MVVERKAWKVSTVSLNGAVKELRDKQPRLKIEKATFHNGMFKVVICWKELCSLVFVL